MLSLVDDERKAKFREAILRKHCAPRVLALIATYYPLVLREKILACCRHQLAGDYRRPCRHHLCPACNSRESHALFVAQYQRFAACTPPGKPVRLGHEVYTLPPHLRGFVAKPDGFAAWRRATLATIREHHGPHAAGIMNLHPIGDENFTMFHPHWDVVINGYTLAGGQTAVHRPPRPDFDRIRAAYTWNLVSELGLEGENVPRSVSIHIGTKTGQFTHSKARTRHIVRYSARHVYLPHRAWLNNAGTRGDWWYKPREGQRAVQVRHGRDAMIALLSHDAKLAGRKRRSWFGYMQNRLSRTSASAFQEAPE